MLCIVFVVMRLDVTEPVPPPDIPYDQSEPDGSITKQRSNTEFNSTDANQTEPPQTPVRPTPGTPISTQARPRPVPMKGIR